MSAFWRIHPNRKSKKDRDYGLVKGGLTPTFPRKQSPVEVTPGEIESNVRRNENEKHPEGSSSSRPLMTQSALQAKLPRWEITPGLLGVYNHGNTCFMNTVIQCLSNTDLFSDYFVKKKFKELLNTKGTIAKRLVGTPKGEVTESLGSLLESIWSGEYTPEVSSQFKNVVSKYNAQYKGSSQHDAQEFLLWLLDRINEEVHQSQKKKTKDSTIKSKKDKQTENPAESSPEVVLSMSSGFEIYNRFQALYQSSLTCPDCGEHSNTYETYLCLSLPVPQKCLRPVFMTVVYLDDNPKQLRIALQMNTLDTVKDLREKLAYELEVPPKRLVLCQIYEDGFRNTYGDEQLLSDIHESENVYVFETHPFSEVNKTQQSYESELIQILLVHVEKVESRYYKFCTPQIIRIPRDINYSTLQKYILRSMGLAVSEEAVDQSVTLDPKHPIFDIRVMDGGVSDCYLSTEVEMPLYTQAIDRAISTYTEEFGPPHVKFVIEWDSRMKEGIVLNDEDMWEEHTSVHKVRLSQQQPTHVSLDECLRLFTKEEMLGDGDAWNCPSCNKDQQGAIKKLGLWSTPDVLVIHLKRFRHVGAKRNKLNILVNFPVTDLEMGAHILPGKDGNHDNKLSDLYDLYAVSNHYGNMNGGHYTAFCKNPIDGRWYEYDDTKVKPLDHRDIVSRAAYLLFYQRKKVINSTVDTLHSGSHWVFSVYGPPQQRVGGPVPEELVHRHSSEVESRKRYDDDLSERDRDYVDNAYNGHKNDEFYESLRVDLNSPRREERDLSAEINSPRQSNRSGGSPRKQLFDNSGQKSSSGDTIKKTSEKAKVTVAEQILQSKTGRTTQHFPTESALPQDQANGFRLEPKFTEYGGDLRVNLHHSSSVDSSKHSYSRTSSSGTSQGSAPPSPQYEAAGSNKTHNVNQNSSNNSARSDNRPLHGAVLNNARDIHVSASSSSSSNVKLKVHSNQIHSDEDTSKSIKKDTNRNDEKFSKLQNQKMSNVSSGTKAQPPSNVFSTPQQGRKSPSPPAQSGRGFWLTPQPQRKQYTLAESTSPRPVMDRQFSFPSRSRPVSDYDMKGLMVEGRRVFDEQPRSLPVDVQTLADKPPRPKTSQGSTRREQSKSNDYDHNRPVPPRPVSSHTSSRVTANSDYKPVGGKEALPSHSVDNHLYEMDSHRMSQPYGEKERNRTTSDRHNANYSQNTRTRSERPLSYHQSSHNDYHDQYYLSQPIDPSNFDRASRYATMRPSRPEAQTDSYLDNEIHHLPRQHNYTQITQDLNQIHLPRSRAPVNYSPHRYQDGGMDYPRYQPHLHQANFMTKLAIQEREYLNRKMKSQCLKESSV